MADRPPLRAEAKRAQREKIKTRLVAIRMDVPRQRRDRARDQQLVAL